MTTKPLWILAILTAGCANVQQANQTYDKNIAWYEQKRARQDEALGRVTMTINPVQVEGCKSAGLVEGADDFILLDRSVGSLDKIRVDFSANGQIAEEAVKRGANVILIGGGSTDRRKVGEAYSCPTP